MVANTRIIIPSKEPRLFRRSLALLVLLFGNVLKNAFSFSSRTGHTRIPFCQRHDTLPNHHNTPKQSANDDHGDATICDPNHRILEQLQQLESLAETSLEQQRAELYDIQESLQLLLDAAKHRDDAQVKSGGHTDQTIEPDDNSSYNESMEATMMQGPEQIECDVCIVGGGPAGCTCALFSARAGLKTVLLDKNPALGALAITSHIVNFPGATLTDIAENDPNQEQRISGEGLLDRMRQQAIDNGAEYRRAQVFMIDGMENAATNSHEEESDPEFIVYTPEAIVKSKALVLATGAMGRVAPPFPGEDTFLGMGVSYCATCDGAFYRDADVAVKGISLEAMEEARFLTKFAKTVHWVTPSKPRPENSQTVKELLDCGNVQKWPLTKFLEVQGDPATGVTGIKVQQKHRDEAEVIPVEGVFIYAGGGGGSKPITDFVSRHTVAFHDNGGVIVDDNMETNVRGVYAIGDIRNTSHKQVVVAASDGCKAAIAIAKKSLRWSDDYEVTHKSVVG